MEQLPDGFAREERRGALIVARRDLLPELLALGLLDRERVAETFAEAPGEAGRGTTARVSLGEPALRLVQLPLDGLVTGGGFRAIINRRAANDSLIDDVVAYFRKR